MVTGNASYLIIVSGLDCFPRRPTLPSFGERLKRTRENKKISLDDVARATKINTRMLAALEQEKFDQLPGGVFNKSFVRTYARHLGLDEEQALRDYNSVAGPALAVGSSEDAELRAIAERKEKERAGRRASQGLPWGIIAALLLVLALGLSVWGFFTREPTSQVHARLSTPAVPSPEAPSAIPQVATDNLAVQPAPTEVARTESLRDIGDNNSTEAEPQATPSMPIALVVKAREDSWLSITVDGKSFYQDTLAAGLQKDVSAQNQVVLKSGNIGGLDITFNGNTLPSQGSAAEVKTLTFTPGGLKQTPTAVTDQTP
jgi:cytoskeleton protein RodZ